MVFLVQTWWHVTWRPTAIWPSFNKHNRWKHLKNSQCDVWSASNNRQVWSSDWSFEELMSMNFNRRTSYEMSCCEIRSSLALGGSESQSFGCVPWNERSTEKWSRLFVQNHHRRWIMVLRVWPGDKATIKSTEKCIISKTKKRRGKSNQMWKPCWSASWTSKGSSTLNSYHKVRLLTSSFTLKCSSDCVVLCEENAPNCGGQVSGFCITTMLPPTQHWVCGSFSRKTGRKQLHTPHTPRTWHPAIFFCFQEWRRTLKESVFRM